MEEEDCGTPYHNFLPAPEYHPLLGVHHSMHATSAKKICATTPPLAPESFVLQASPAFVTSLPKHPLLPRPLKTVTKCLLNQLLLPRLLFLVVRKTLMLLHLVHQAPALLQASQSYSEAVKKANPDAAKEQIRKKSSAIHALTSHTKKVPTADCLQLVYIDGILFKPICKIKRNLIELGFNVCAHLIVNISFLDTSTCEILMTPNAATYFKYKIKEHALPSLHILKNFDLLRLLTLKHQVHSRPTWSTATLNMLTLSSIVRGCHLSSKSSPPH
ncbi:hypothetical protein DSO57_1026922 [Entomophthora muscae]|uniref:Uncharacterized protein n=1 Tax=Entomophthora muscae TaxID=34485 RepID=A0ACC2S3S9_9FUNG|nr:hypothetical protein DSO57_1026922 [Entomophthora muscae]